MSQLSVTRNIGLWKETRKPHACERTEYNHLICRLSQQEWPYMWPTPLRRSVFQAMEKEWENVSSAYASDKLELNAMK